MVTNFYDDDHVKVNAFLKQSIKYIFLPMTYKSHPHGIKVMHFQKQIIPIVSDGRVGNHVRDPIFLLVDLLGNLIELF